MECTLIFSKATNKYILIVPTNFDPDVLSKLRNAFVKVNDIPKKKLIVLPQGRDNHSDTLDGYVEV